MTTATSIHWEPAYVGGRMEKLDVTECLRLLASTNVGRIGYSVHDEQRIIPMNYVLTAEHVVLRTSVEHDLGQFVCGRPVAFEVDAVDSFLQSGWSVLISGVAEELPEATQRAMKDVDTPQPWAAGVRALYVRIPLTRVTGRRVHPV